MLTWRVVRPLRGLCVDIENMPGTYGPGEYTHPKVTAVGWGWNDRKTETGWPTKIKGRALIRNDSEQMLKVAAEFRSAWDEADFIIGHNVRRHDRKILDGWYMTLGLPLLQNKRMVDTYSDMPKVQGLSRSLENLTSRWGCPIHKPHLEEHVWEAAYDGIEWAVDVMRRRVMSDVRINLWLYWELQERGLLTRF